MKRILIPLVLLAFTLTALAQSGGTVKSVNDTNELVMLNPRSANTNVLVHAMPWLSSSFWTWHEGDATPADTNHLDSVLYPGLGRWVWNNIGTNYFQTLVVSNFVGAGDSLWTNLGGILQPQNLTLPVMITNQFQFGPGTTNVLYRSGPSLQYTNGAADVHLTVLNGSAVGVALEAQSASSVGVETTGSPTVMFLRNGADQAAMVTGQWRPGTDLSLSLGNITAPRWANVVGTNLYMVGFVDNATNFSRLSIYQPNTNSPVIFDQQTAESAGASRGFSFRTNGVEVFNVTGTGGPSSGANWVASGTTNSTLAGTANVNSLTATNQMGFKGYATASLPVAVATGYQTYCTDCITPWGTGDRVEWDGSAWRTLRARITASSSILAYATNSIAMGWTGRTPNEWAFMGDTFASSGIRMGQASTAGGGYDYQISSSFGILGSYSMPSAVQGFYAYAMAAVIPSAASDCLASSSALSVSNLPDGTDTYYSMFGWIYDGQSTNSPTRGAFVLNDVWKIFPNNPITGASTNNWILVTTNNLAATGQFTDTGLAVSTSTTSPDRISIVWLNGSVYCYTNGMPSCTNTIGIPTSGTMFGCLKGYRTAGSNARSAYYANTRFSRHYQSASSFF